MPDEALIAKVGFDTSKLTSDLAQVNEFVRKYEAIIETLKQVLQKAEYDVAQIKLAPDMDTKKLERELSKITQVVDFAFKSAQNKTKAGVADVRNELNNLVDGLEDGAGQRLSDHLTKRVKDVVTYINNLTGKDFGNVLYNKPIKEAEELIGNLISKADKYEEALKKSEARSAELIDKINQQAKAVEEATKREKELRSEMDALSKDATSEREQREAAEATNKALQAEVESLKEIAHAKEVADSSKALEKELNIRKLITSQIEAEKLEATLKAEAEAQNNGKELSPEALQDYYWNNDRYKQLQTDITNASAALNKLYETSNVTADDLLAKFNELTELANSAKDATDKAKTTTSFTHIKDYVDKIKEAKEVLSQGGVEGSILQNIFANIYGTTPEHIIKKLETEWNKVSKRARELSEQAKEKEASKVEAEPKKQASLKEIIDLEIQLAQEEDNLAAKNQKTSKTYEELFDKVREAQASNKFFNNKDLEDFDDAVKTVYNKTKTLFEFLKDGGDKASIANKPTEWINNLKRDVGDTLQIINGKGYKKNILTEMFSSYGPSNKDEIKKWIDDIAKEFKKIDDAAAASAQKAKLSAKQVRDALKPTDIKEGTAEAQAKTLGEAIESAGNKAKVSSKHVQDAEKAMVDILARPNKGNAATGSSDKISLSLDRVAVSADKAAQSLEKVATTISGLLKGDFAALIQQLTQTSDSLNNLGSDSTKVVEENLVTTKELVTSTIFDMTQNAEMAGKAFQEMFSAKSSIAQGGIINVLANIDDAMLTTKSASEEVAGALAKMNDSVGDLDVWEKVSGGKSADAVVDNTKQVIDNTKVVLSESEYIISDIEQSMNDLVKSMDAAEQAAVLGGGGMIESQKQLTDEMSRTTNALVEYKNVAQDANAAVKESVESAGSAADESVQTIQATKAQMRAIYTEYMQLIREVSRFSKEEETKGVDNSDYISPRLERMTYLQQYIELQDKAVRSDEKEAAILREVKKAQEAVGKARRDAEAKSSDRQNRQAENELVRQAAEAYKRLKEAYNGYVQTTKNGDDAKRGVWADQITAQTEILDSIRKQADELDHNSEAYKKIQRTLRDSAQASLEFDDNVKSIGDHTKQVNNTVEQIFRRLYSMLILRYLRQMLRDCVSYVKEFDAAMTDVRMVTKMSAEDADAFGESIRNAATELRVTSTDLAKGAVSIFRQGIADPEEVIDISKWTAVLAAITSDTSDNVLDYMTASLQNFRADGEEMADTAERVADVWGWMGDQVATTASKIGTAMSKTAASASTVGLSLEKTSAMIAVIQAKTQDSAESIGTSLNSMLSRYMKIAQAGFGSIFEDEDGEMVKVNDVAKAFSAIGIEVYNAATGFANFGDVMDQLAAKWDTLSDAEQKYAATQLAGTRNVNRLLAMMNNYSEVLELEAGAYDSAGAAMEKYNIWMDSVEAAQNKLTNSLQNLYGTLDSDVMKGFYNTLSNVVDWLTAATKGTKGLNIVITALGVAVAAVVVSIAKMGGIPAIIKGIATAFMGVFTASKAAAAGVATLNTAMSASLVGIALLVGTSLIGWLISATDNSKKLAEANEKVKDTLDEINDSQKKVTKIDSLFSQLDEIGSSAGTAEEKMNDLNTVRQAIIDMSPEIARKYGLEKEAIGDYADEIDRTAQALRDLQEEQWNESISAARKASSSSNRVSDAYGGMYQDAQKLLAFLQSGGKDASYEGKLYRQSASSIFDSEKFDYEVLSEMSTILGKIWSESEWGGEEGFIDASWLEDYIEEYINDVETKLYDAAKSALYANANKIDWGDIGYTMRYQILDGLAKSMVNNNMNVDDVMSQLNDEMLPYVLDMIDIMNTSAADLIEQSMNSNDIDKRIFSAKKALMNTPLYNFAEDAQQYFSDAWKPLNEAREAFYDKIYTDDYDYIQEFADAAGQFGEEYAEAWHKITYVIDAIRGTEYDNESVWDALTKYLGVDENDPKYLTNKEEYFVDLVNRYLGLYRVAQRETMAIEEGLKFPEGKSPFDTFFASLLGSPSADEDILEKIKGIQTVIKDIDALVQMSEDINNDDFAANMLGGKYDEDLLKRYPQILELLNDEAALQKYIAQIIQEQVDGIRQQGEEYSKLYDQRTEQEYEEDAQKFFAADPEKAEEMWEEFDEETKKYIEDHYDYARGMFEDIGDDYDDLWKDMKDAAKKGTKDINKNIAKAQIDKLFDEKKINKTTKDVLNTLVDNTDDAIDTVSSFTKDVQSLMEAQEALNFVQQDGASEMEGYSDYVKTLSEYLGYDVSTMNDFSMAASLLSGNVLMAGSSAEYLMNTLYAISGATFDASNWQSQLAGLEGGSNSCANALAVLIAYLQSIDGTTINFDGDKFTVGNLGSVKIPKVSGGGGGRGSGGGGGGGGGSSKTKSQVESILEEIKGLLEVIEYERNLYKALQEYYDEQGLTQGVILWMEKESEAIQRSIDTIEKYMGTLESMIKDKEAEIAKLKVGSSAYETAVEELHDLQEAHHDYTVELVESRTEIIKLQKSIEDFNKEIRDMQIEIIEMVEEAIQDREELLRDMRDGTIDVEDAILDAIKARYEKEHEMLEELAQSKIDALNEEIDAIDELLDKRRELNEEEKTANEIAEIEAKLARISADPTRAKEAMELQKKLNDLREEQAWDIAEKEAEAQKASLQEEVDSVEDYIEQLDKYYEDLFEHPQKLIEEMREIIKGTDEEIISWLKEQTEEYSQVTTTRQEAMVVEWQEMIDQMRGITRTYWEEAEQIVSQGDDAIIAFLKEHSADYREAGKLQAEAYVDEWKKKLEELRLALQVVEEEYTVPEYTTTTTPTGGGGSGSGGGAGGGTAGGGGGSTGAAQKKVVQKATEQVGQAISTVVTGITGLITGAVGVGGGGSAVGVVRRGQLAAYDSGGLVNYTGIAQLDGSPMKPERVLSPYQTALFEDMLKTLHEMKTYRFNMSSIVPNLTDGANTNIAVDQINITVEKLDDDQDVAELADKVQVALMDAINRGAAVGGIRQR